MTVHLANLYAAPVEIVESEFPCRIRRFELNPDSGGAGEYRGGLNFRRVYEMLEPAELVYRSDRASVPPFPGSGPDTPVSLNGSLRPRNDPKNSPSLPSLSWKETRH